MQNEVKKLKLAQLSKETLKERQMNALKGGRACACGGYPCGINGHSMDNDGNADSYAK